MPGPALVDLVGGVALPLAAAALAQARMRRTDRRPTRAAMISAVCAGPAEVGAVDDAGREAGVGERARPGRAACSSPSGGERRVEPALPAVLEVPFRLAVADDQEVAHGWVVNQSAGRRFDPYVGPGAKLDRSV